ncbi:hypothetical protein AZO1586I_2220 [Bathymodiolus thermophilus thioautotrophic gill symbiont]|uniref:Uncharacterized protein n=2 Tax=Bathymodiolus thermophilus thioautotrophic gill symbiont TaxID=2360 RepID=A0ABM8MAZ0_9GAMM|nr:hypothetical protein AZO1586I_2220 [Bathymodiolus thermophilus thioautotrophic gill symbiont]
MQYNAYSKAFYVFFKICMANALQMRMANVLHFKPIPTLFTPLHTRASGV